jgi:hypothetical protein
MLLPDELQEAVHEGGVHVCLGLLLPGGTVYLICTTTDWQCQACKHHRLTAPQIGSTADWQHRRLAVSGMQAPL